MAFVPHPILTLNENTQSRWKILESIKLTEILPFSCSGWRNRIRQLYDTLPENTCKYRTYLLKSDITSAFAHYEIFFTAPFFSCLEMFADILWVANVYQYFHKSCFTLILHNRSWMLRLSDRAPITYIYNIYPFSLCRMWYIRLCCYMYSVGSSQKLLHLITSW